MCHRRVFFCMLVALFCASTVVSAYADLGNSRWNIEILASSGSCQCLALDSLGNPHIISGGTYSKKVGGTQWTTETIPIDTGYLNELSFKIDNNDCPHLCYASSTVGLIYTTKQGTTWSTEIIQKEPAVCASIFLDSDNRPHIAYIDVDENRSYSSCYRLRYAEKTASDWQIETVEIGCMNPSLFLDPLQRPHISYLDFSPLAGYIKYAYKCEGNWQIETIQKIPGWPSYGWLSSTSLFLDHQNNPHISYQGGGQYYRLMYATKTEEGWLTESVDWDYWDYWSGYHSSLSLDNEGNPHISYVNGGPGGIKGFTRYAVKRGGYWWKEVIDNLAYGTTSSLCLDSLGNPHISYSTSSGGNRYASALEYYQLKVMLKGTAGQPLPGKLQVFFSDGEPYTTMNFSNDGEVCIDHVPIGMYTVQGEYKGFCQTQNMPLDGSKNILFELDIFVEILGLPLTYVQTVSLFSIFAIMPCMALIAILLIKKKIVHTTIKSESLRNYKYNIVQKIVTGSNLRTGTVAVGAILLIIGLIVLVLGIQALQVITSPAGQALLFFSTQAEIDAAWAKVNGLLFGGGILFVIGLIALIVGAASKGEPSSFARAPAIASLKKCPKCGIKFSSEYELCPNCKEKLEEL